MSNFDVHIEQVVNGSWQVRGGKAPTNREFRHRAHALAFARALACSNGSNLYLREPDGSILHHARSSLTYPTTLD